MHSHLSSVRLAFLARLLPGPVARATAPARACGAVCRRSRGTQATTSGRREELERKAWVGPGWAENLMKA